MVTVSFNLLNYINLYNLILTLFHFILFQGGTLTLSELDDLLGTFFVPKKNKNTWTL